MITNEIVNLLVINTCVSHIEGQIRKDLYVLAMFIHRKVTISPVNEWYQFQYSIANLTPHTYWC